jgi:hypothetical protein
MNAISITVRAAAERKAGGRRKRRVELKHLAGGPKNIYNT